MRKIILLITLASHAMPVIAVDEMELQRCIWRCLANSKGNTDPAYHSCVEKYCTETSSRSINEKEGNASVAYDEREFTTIYNEHGAVLTFRDSGHMI